MSELSQESLSYIQQKTMELTSQTEFASYDLHLAKPVRLRLAEIASELEIDTVSIEKPV